jgi:putative ABC transport system substrate-binding protein
VIDRRRLALAGALGALVVSGSIRAQSAAALRRVGVLGAARPDENTRGELRRGMLELGWVEGRNIEYRFANADGQENRLDALAGELIAGGAEVIVTSSAVSTRALQRATKTLPIVMVNVVNPVANGFAASLARPGGNITGLTNQQEDVLGKLVEFLHQLVPQARRIAFAFNENNPSYAAYRLAAQQACSTLGLTALFVDASSGVHLPAAVEQIRAQRAQGVVIAADPLYTAQADAWLELLAPTRLPVVYGQRHHVERGGLLSYGANFNANWRSAARYVDRILKGAQPGDLPIERPTRFELVINLRAARAQGLTVPPALLQRADEVIQ